MRSQEVLKQSIQQAVIDWAQAQYQIHDVSLGLIEPDEDDPERWLVDFAIPTIPYWQVAEVWLEHNKIVSINDLGEGVAPDGVAWPWDSH